MEKFLLAVLLPLMPAFIFGMRQLSEHSDSAARLDRLRENTKSLMRKATSKRLNPSDLELESYSLQTLIYESRRRSPLILDWIYRKFEDNDEETMNEAANSLIKELSQIP